MKIVKLIITGLILSVVVLLIEGLVTLPLGSPASESPDIIRRYLVWEFLLTAVPAGFLSNLASKMMKLKAKAELLWASALWTATYVALMLIVAIGNNNIGPVFGNFAFYVLLACYFYGPFLKLRKPKTSDFIGRGPKML
jgi:peptidoglycan/LPS O-acetylase OafA/YrhL